MKQRLLVAIYIDLENVSGILSLRSLFQTAILEDSNRIDQEGRELVFVVKEAFGRTESITPLRKDLIDFNFDIHETPHLPNTQFKNRADLMISIAAFEAAHVNDPDIDVFIFVSTDSDFSVIMDKLRKYGKEVWLFAREEDVERKIFNNSCDRIFPIQRLTERAGPKQRTQDDQSNLTILTDNLAISMLARVLSSLEVGSWHLSSTLGIKFHQIDKSFDLKSTSFRGIEPMLAHLHSKKILELKDNDKGHLQARVVDVSKLTGLLDNSV